MELNISVDFKIIEAQVPLVLTVFKFLSFLCLSY